MIHWFFFRSFIYSLASTSWRLAAVINYRWEKNRNMSWPVVSKSSILFHLSNSYFSVYMCVDKGTQLGSFSVLVLGHISTPHQLAWHPGKGVLGSLSECFYTYSLVYVTCPCRKFRAIFWGTWFRMRKFCFLYQPAKSASRIYAYTHAYIHTNIPTYILVRIQADGYTVSHSYILVHLYFLLLRQFLSSRVIAPVYNAILIRISAAQLVETVPVSKSDAPNPVEPLLMSPLQL